MKKTHIFFGLFTVGVLFAACDKELMTDPIPQNRDLASNGTIRVQNSALGTARTFIYLDNKVVNATALDYNVTFPTAASTPGFSVSPGSHTLLIKDTSPTATVPPVTVNQTVGAGKVYTVYLYDTVPNIKQTVVEFDAPTVFDTVPKVRLGHFAFQTGTTPPAIDVFSKNRNANIFTNVPYGQVSAFTSYNTGVTDTLIVRPTGSTTVNLDTATFAPGQRRYYTLVFNGRYATANPTATPRTLVVTTTY